MSTSSVDDQWLNERGEPLVPEGRPFTGNPPGPLQDDDRGLSRWLSQRGPARQLADEAAAAISAVGERLTSMNQVPVTVARITAKEFESISAALSSQAAMAPVILTPGPVEPLDDWAKAGRPMGPLVPVAAGADHLALLREAATLFRSYERSHRARGPEHLQKAERNAEIAGRIEAALIAQPAPAPAGEPVAWVNAASLASASVTRSRGGPADVHSWSELQTMHHTVPLYTAPPAAARVPLTAEQCAQICEDLANEWQSNDMAEAYGMRVAAGKIREAASQEGGAL